MNTRERVLVALDGGEPDRIPCALAFYHLNMRSLIPAEKYHPDLVDVQFVNFPLSPEERQLAHRIEKYPEDTRLGNLDQVTTYSRWSYHPERRVNQSPLVQARSLDDFRRFPFPELNCPFHTNSLADQVQNLHSQDLAVGGNLPHLGGELFEAAWRLRGLENFLIDLIERPDWADYLLNRLTELAQHNAKTMASAGVDILALDDDIGMPGTMMISPTLWRRFFKPRLSAIIHAAQVIKPDLRVLFHSDGYFEPIIEDLIEIGVNAINPLQPDHMDASRIRQRYGPQLVLWGTVGWQTTFSFSTPETIRQEVRQRVETLGRAGLILCPAYDIDEPDIPVENVISFLAASREFG